MKQKQEMFGSNCRVVKVCFESSDSESKSLRRVRNEEIYVYQLIPLVLPHILFWTVYDSGLIMGVLLEFRNTVLE